jgi:hypothetical protein
MSGNGETEIEAARASLENHGFTRDQAEAALVALTIDGFLVIRTQALMDRVMTKFMEARS